MTPEEVVRGAWLLNRWRQLHQIRASVARCTALNDLDVWGEDEILEVALVAAQKAADLKIEELIGRVHTEAVGLGIKPPFPSVARTIGDPV